MEKVINEEINNGMEDRDKQREMSKKEMSVEGIYLIMILWCLLFVSSLYLLPSAPIKRKSQKAYFFLRILRIISAQRRKSYFTKIKEARAAALAQW